jgi:hypothetical protein
VLVTLNTVGHKPEDVKNINIEVDEEQYESLKETKKRHGLTWRGMLLHAQRQLDSGPATE